MFEKGEVEIQDPLRPESRYLLKYAKGSCPHVEVHHTWGGRTSSPCVACSYHFCEACDAGTDGADFTTLPRALVAAIYAGRRIEELNSDSICSTVPVPGRIRAEVRDGQRPEGEEARPGLTEEPSVARVEAIAAIRPYFTIDAAPAPAVPTERTIELVQEPQSDVPLGAVRSPVSYNFRLRVGDVTKTVRWINAWEALWNAPGDVESPF